MNRGTAEIGKVGILQIDDDLGRGTELHQPFSASERSAWLSGGFVGSQELM